MQVSCERVFGTPELLEAILSHLPPRALLHAQRISHRFKTAITSSPILQQALFFRAAPCKTTVTWTLNPLLRDPFMPWLVFPEDRWQLPDYETLELLDWVPDQKRRNAFLHPDASWRRMFLIQPPPKRLLISERVHTQGDDDFSEGSLSFDDGITMDVLYDLAYEFVARNIVSGFGLRIVMHPSTSSDSASQSQVMVLDLSYTQQCCSDSEVRPLDLTSCAEKIWGMQDIVFENKPNGAMGGRGSVFWDGGWESDLTAEKGGLSGSDLKEWTRKRVPISHPLADVR